MTGSRWFIILVLAVLTVGFTLQAVRTWMRPLQGLAVAEPDEDAGKTSLPPLVKKREPPMSAYDVIAARSLFDKDRTEGEIEMPVGNLKDADTSRYAKRIGLFGVIIEDGEKMALVNKDMGRRGSDEYLWVRVGDQIDRLKVVGIERDRIYLQENGSRYEILFSDQRQPSKRVKEEKSQGPTVISTGVPAEKPAERKPKIPKVRVKTKTGDSPGGD